MSTAKFTYAAKRIKALVGFVSEPNSKLFSAFAFCQNRRVPLLAELAESAERGFLASSTAGSGFAAACRGCPAKCPCSRKTACSRRSVLKSKSKELICDETIGVEKGFLLPRPRQSGALPQPTVTILQSVRAQRKRRAHGVPFLETKAKSGFAPKPTAWKKAFAARP